MLPSAAKKPRDPRLDFFRGLSLFFIFLAHLRGDWLAQFIPARFGLSDAADAFVFLSGMAAAIAFGGTFARRGFRLGLARIALRCWQLFIAHLGLFIALAVVAAGADALSGPGAGGALGLQRFLNDPGGAMLGIVTLTYIPDNLDILPLYITVLALVPGAMLLSRLHPLAVMAVSIGLYAFAWATGFNLPAGRGPGSVWYFNPLCWQMIFFTGFSIGRGWIRPRLGWWPVLAPAILVVVAGAVVSFPGFQGLAPAIDTLHGLIQRHADKTDLDPLRYGHFLALAYVAASVIRGRETLLIHPRIRAIHRCGQQGLSVFLTGEILSQTGGVVLDRLGTGAPAQILVNVLGILGMIAIARVVGWFKSVPWQQPPPIAPRPAAASAQAPPSNQAASTCG
jgi:hypothetical protein